MHPKDIFFNQQEQRRLEPDDNPATNLRCHCCGDKLYSGERYIQVPTSLNLAGLIYCNCCINQMDREELLKLHNIELKWEEA